MITAFVNGLSGNAATPDAAMAPPVVADDDVAPGRADRLQHAQGVVHQSPDVIAPVGRNRRGQVTPHERRHHFPAGLRQNRRHFAPAVGCVGKTVQTQRNRAILRPPHQRPQLYSRGGDIDPAWLGHSGTGSYSDISQRSPSLTMVARATDGVFCGM